MNKEELVTAIAARTNLEKTKVQKVLDAFTETVKDTLRKGEKIALIGFCGIEVANRAAREGRNPQTGAKIQIPATRTVKFTAGKTLKDAVGKA